MKITFIADLTVSYFHSDGFHGFLFSVKPWPPTKKAIFPFFRAASTAGNSHNQTAALWTQDENWMMMLLGSFAFFVPRRWVVSVTSGRRFLSSGKMVWQICITCIRISWNETIFPGLWSAFLGCWYPFSLCGKVAQLEQPNLSLSWHFHKWRGFASSGLLSQFCFPESVIQACRTEC